MKRVLVDMDGVLCDFYNAAKQALIENPKQHYPQGRWGFFLKLKPLPKALESYQLLEKHFDVRILTRPSHMNVNCYTEKAQWIWDHLGIKVLEKAIFSGDKSIIEGDYLIDDQDNAKQADFKGEWIKFGSDTFPDWEHIVKYILNKEEIQSTLITEL